MLKGLNRAFSDYPVYPERVLQFGEGNFLRGFADWQIQMLNEKAGFNGSAVVVQPRGSGKIERLNQQDGLFTLYLQGIKDGQTTSAHVVVHSVSRGIDLAADYGKFVGLAEKEELRFIISNATEAGIAFEEDARLEERPQKGFPARLTAFLYHRYQAFQGDVNKGCVIIPCELIEDNGPKLQQIVLKYAMHWNLEEAFIDWLQSANTFCSSLVDRIVPGFPKDTSEEKEEELGYRDELMVVSEPYYLWVIQGPEWLKQELPFEEAGLNSFIVDDLAKYRERKVRILNGAHTAMLPVCYLYGLRTVGESVSGEVTGPFIKDLITEEIIPAMDDPQNEMKVYAEEVMERFMNPYIHHFLRSLAMNAISKFKARNVPSVLDFVKRKGKLPSRHVFALSALLYFYKGKRGEQEIPLDDSPGVVEGFCSLWKRFDDKEITIEELAGEVLSNELWWGTNLAEIPDLTAVVASNLTAIEEQGMKAALHGLNTAISSKGVVR